jgi:sialidase-1
MILFAAFFAISAVFACGAVSAVSAQTFDLVYRPGEAGYTCFRIPSVITTPKGTVLAFAEARKNDCSDAGDIDLVVKRSSDGGKTWGALEVVWNDSTNTCGNPAPVIDERTGAIVLLSTWNRGEDREKAIHARTSLDTRRVFVFFSTDDGQTWSAPRQITRDVKPENWTWYATGPGRGIQLSKGRHKGRLVIPCNHVVAGINKSYSHVIYSDDDGKRWKLGGIAQEGTNESTVAELSNGDLLLNMRSSGKGKARQVAISTNGGKRWKDEHSDTTLIEPVCEGSLIDYRFSGKKGCLVFSNPASRTGRRNMTVRLSYDDGKTWPVQKVLYEGPSAYSCLTVLPDGHIGCLYEAGVKKPYEGIVWADVDPAGMAGQ